MDKVELDWIVMLLVSYLLVIVVMLGDDNHAGVGIGNIRLLYIYLLT